MKIIVLTAVWKRHELFRIFKQGFNRINKDSNHELTLVTIGSEEIKFSSNHVETENKPLSNKWQKGIDYIKDMEFDYVLMLGSDDIVCSKLLKVYTKSMEESIDLIGLIDCYFLDSRDSTFKFWQGYKNHRRGESIGMARMISKRLIEKMGWKVWSDGLNKGLDSSMMKNLKRIKYTEKMFNCKKEGIAAIDIKTDINVSNIKHYPYLRPEKFINLSNFISEKEFYSILNLR